MIILFYPTDNVTMSTDEGLETKRLVTLGCAPTHSWCTTTPIITIPQFAVGFTLAILSFPVAYCLLPSMFTKVIQPGRQVIIWNMLLDTLVFAFYMLLMKEVNSHRSCIQTAPNDLKPFLRISFDIRLKFFLFIG